MAKLPKARRGRSQVKKGGLAPPKVRPKNTSGGKDLEKRLKSKWKP